MENPYLLTMKTYHKLLINEGIVTVIMKTQKELVK